MRPEIPRGSMTAVEREIRSRAKQLLEANGFLLGSLSDRAQTCGNSNCRCARGERHRCLYLVFTSDGRQHQIYIPRSLEETVRRWVGQTQELQEFLRRLSALHLERILKTKKKKSEG